MIKNNNGQVAIKHYPPVQKFITNVPSGVDGYVFAIRANIAMAWVNEEDVQNVMSRIARGCCGRRKRRYFQYANADDVRRWTNGGGR